MDYDGIDWQALAGGQFSAHGIADDFYHYFPLDLYLMGLIPAPSVGSFYVIQNPSGNSGTITGTAKTIAVDNVIWAEGPRNPAWPNTQTVFKQAFVVLTKDTRASSTFINQVAAQRRAFTWQFYKATGFLGRVDTTLRGFVLLPRLQGISVAVDDDRAMVGWRTFPATTRGRVNYALTPTAFRRDQAHTEPFSTVTEAVAGTSHGVQLAGLAANTPYYVEVVAETAEGLVVRAQSVLYTRKQTDGCAPDINNVSVGFVRDKTDAVVAGWHTDEPSDSRVRYGTSTPPGLQSYDAYPTTSHSIALTGLAAGTYFLSVESRDAAGNLTVDNNGGNYYQVTVPTPAAPGFAASNADEISARAAQINEAVAAGDTARAVLQTSELILDVAQAELRHIVETADLPGDPLEAGCQALQVLADRAGSTVSVVARGDGYADLAADPDPLYRLCLRLPADTAAQEAGYPVLSRVVAEVNPSLTIEPRPDLGPGRYRLRYTGS
jgi:hypothetical protein